MIIHLNRGEEVLNKWEKMATTILTCIPIYLRYFVVSTYFYGFLAKMDGKLINLLSTATCQVKQILTWTVPTKTVSSFTDTLRPTKNLTEELDLLN